MYSIADRHFTWAMEYLSRACRMSPDLAGLTLLAFGNGAPDFFTAVFGASEEPELILGSSAGSGLFIITVVFGLVLITARKPGKDKTLVLEDGRELAIAPPEQATDNKKRDDRIFKCMDIRHRLEPIPFLRSAGMYLMCVGLLLLLTFIKRIPLWLPLLFLGFYFLYLGICIALHFGVYQRRKLRSGSKSLEKAASSVFAERNFQEERKEAKEKFDKLSVWEKFYFAIKRTCLEEEEKGGVGDGEQGSPSKRMMEYLKIASVVLCTPINLALNLTILPIEDVEESFNADNYVSLRFLHRIRCVLNPFLSIPLYLFIMQPILGSLLNWKVLTAYAIGSTFLSICLWLGTFWDESPRLFPLHIAYSFCTSILWIYFTCSELVACLSTNGALLGIPQTVMGITVLAWGNSFGDLVADVAIAKNGSFETAVTAVFSGPVQNVLLTIGAGFLIAAIRSPSRSVTISSFTSDVYMYLTLAVLLAVILLCLLAIPLKFDFCVSRTFGFVLLAIYFLYLPCALFFGLNIFHLPFL